MRNQYNYLRKERVGIERSDKALVLRKLRINFLKSARPAILHTKKSVRAFLEKVNMYAPTCYSISYLELLFKHHLPVFTPTYLIRKLVRN